LSKVDSAGAVTSHSAMAEPEGTTLVRYRIDKMDCPTEERLIRNRLEPMPGIARLDFNLLDRELTVHHRLDDPKAIVIALTALDMGPNLIEAGATRMPFHLL